MTSKTLTSGIAAAAFIGAIGLAYAQTTNDPATNPSTTQTTPSSAEPTAPAAMPDAATTQPSGTTNTAAPAELPAQADRN